MNKIKVKIFGIVYGDKETEYTPYINRHKAKLWRFENNCMIDIVDNMIEQMADTDYLGIFSWKFGRKTGITKAMLHKQLLNAEPADVYNFSPYLGKHIHFMNWSDEGHKGIKDFIIRCCNHVGLVYNNDCEHVIYANQFITTKKIYNDYIQTVVKPCLELLEGEMWDEVNVDAGYTQALASELLKQSTGLEFYNYVPFILERMFMQYVDNKKLKTIRP